MELELKPDIAKTLERFEAWWHGQIVDRPPVSLDVRSSQPPAATPEKAHATWRDYWFDLDYRMDVAEAKLCSGVYLTDTIPRFFPNMGPEVCATVFGADLEFSETTAWSKPIARSCRQIPSLQPNLDNPYWNAVRRLTEMSLERGAGRWITGLTDLHTNGDLVAALREPQDLCLDLADDPASVRAACDYVTAAGYQPMFEDLWDRVRAAGQPCTTWAPTLHAGRAYVTNCDFICMISPRQFEQAILPSIVAEMRYLERNIFHLDGPGALRHLPTLLALPELDGLQWVYGAGNGPAARWVDVYRRAQDAGKCLQVCCRDMQDAEAVARQLRPEGVWLDIGGSYSREEAEAFLRDVDRWAAGKGWKG